MKLVLASSNAGKLAELRDLLGDGYQLHAQSSLGVEDAEETGLSFVENAILKARHASRATGLPALGDDSGLCVDALQGAPGLYSARYAGTHGDGEANIDKLLRALEAVPDDARDARFVCVLALARHADDPEPLLAEGVWRGRILRERRGSNGFGYDPVFFSPPHGCSAAELPAEAKHRASHRGIALVELQRRLAMDAASAHGMHVVAWEYRVRNGCEAEFEALYGPGGAWVALFRGHAGYVGTELLRGLEDGRYLSLDRWASEAAYAAFLAATGPAYAAIDARGDLLTLEERHLGAWRRC